MKNKFLSNKNSEFLNKIKDNLKACNSFYFTVSFIKKAGLILLEREIEEALERGAVGKIITSTYQNFTDISSLEQFYNWQKEFDNFECHLDYECFGESGYHSKGYMFEYNDSFEFVVGSSNITRFALTKNIEWNVSLIAKDDFDSYKEGLKEFNILWNKTLELDYKLIEKYKLQLDYAIEKWDMDYINATDTTINPNSMQRKALRELRRYRDTGVKKALIISATGSGKTYLAAFDARNFGAKRLLYIVHRESILKDARDSFIKIFGAERTYGFFTGNESNQECDFIFATSNMLGRHLDEFDRNEFEYIIYDEVHHVVADTGKKIFEYFKPEFMLGLTATPERMDNQNVFEFFDQNVPFELRLRDAINNDLVVPFHYYGIRDELVDYSSKDRMVIAKAIAAQDNIEFIKEQIEKHKKVGEKLKCIAFCTNIQHCKLMAEELYEEGYNTISLTGINDTGVRIKAFKDLQDDNNPLEIICTVDILNEGVDIPQINMVLFLRPTESQTVFIQQLGRGLRKYPGKEYVTVLDFIGNNYDRAVQIAMALGTLSNTTYIEKAYLKDMISTNFKSLDIPNVLIDIDDLSKEEIIEYIDKTNFNSKAFLEKDYTNFKNYINNGSYPSHMDFLNSDVAPDLIRIIKTSFSGSKNMSYYNFLKKINEETIPIFNEIEIKIINIVEDLLPIARLDEYLIIEQAIKEGIIDLKRLEGRNAHITEKTLENAYNNLVKLGVLENNKFDLLRMNNDELKDYLIDTLNYGIIRYNREFGEYEGLFKLYRNYYKEQASRIMLKNGLLQKGTYYEDDVAYIFAGIKKDEDGKLNYKDKFLNSKVFQWESIADVSENEKRNLRNAKKVHLFIRKMESEDTVTLPYTYFGLGSFTNERPWYTEEDGVKHPTLLFDIILDNEVPKEYFVDFEISNN
ncbi:MAG: DEAD/DEAH box helicase family protein [Bacilli bacterium]|nr:DEAD/DEAH box helicase family protein [Bacilli bacterium]